MNDNLILSQTKLSPLSAILITENTSVTSICLCSKFQISPTCRGSNSDPSVGYILAGVIPLNLPAFAGKLGKGIVDTIHCNQ